MRIKERRVLVGVVPSLGVVDEMRLVRKYKGLLDTYTQISVLWASARDANPIPHDNISFHSLIC